MLTTTLLKEILDIDNLEDDIEEVEYHIVDDPEAIDTTDYDWTKRGYTEVDKVFNRYDDPHRISDDPNKIYKEYSKEYYSVIFQVYNSYQFGYSYIAYIKGY